MIRHFLCLGVVLLAILLSVPGCGDGKNQKKAPTVPDPDGNFVPKPGGAKPG
jgi:hypothetical protein